MTSLSKSQTSSSGQFCIQKAPENICWDKGWLKIFGLEWAFYHLAERRSDKRFDIVQHQVGVKSFSNQGDPIAPNSLNPGKLATFIVLPSSVSFSFLFFMFERMWSVLWSEKRLLKHGWLPVFSVFPDTCRAFRTSIYIKGW